MAWSRFCDSSINANKDIADVQKMMSTKSATLTTTSLSFIIQKPFCSPTDVRRLFIHFCTSQLCVCARGLEDSNTTMSLQLGIKSTSVQIPQEHCCFPEFNLSKFARWGHI